MRAIVDPISQPPGRRRERHCLRNWRGEDVEGSMCSITSKRVIMSNCGLGVDVYVGVDVGVDCDEDGDGDTE